jgi:4-hydroxy-3-methylbut-2-enyl diphosphate reductase
MQVYLAQPRGFCAGVRRAIDIVEGALEKFGAPIYVRHEIIHNRFVVDQLKAKGVVFVDQIDDIPDGSITIFSAHGVSDKVEHEASERELPVIDATCPLVKKVHLQVAKFEKLGCEIVLIGHRGHPEVEGTAGRSKSSVHIVANSAEVEQLEIQNPEKVAYVTQTTLSVDDTQKTIDVLRSKFPAIKSPSTDDICFASQNRQQAVRELAQHVDLILVIGAANSSNSNRLVDIGRKAGVPSFLIETPEQIDVDLLGTAERVGLTAGASVPEELIEIVIKRLQGLRQTEVISAQGVEENIQFKLPATLLNSSQVAGFPVASST